MPVDKRERRQANFLRIFEGEGEHHRIGENIFWGKVVEGGGALEVLRSSANEFPYRHALTK